MYTEGYIYIRYC